MDGQPDPLPSGRNSNLEGLYDLVFAAQGIRVVVTDYIGMGTPGVHTFMNRLDQAHAMIDAARAVRSLVEHAGEGTDAPVGPGANDTVCGCGHCIDPGLDEHWWRERQSSLYDSGAVMVETDGDRISVFFPQLPGTVLDRAAVIGRCCSAGMVRDTLRLFDREDREVFTGLRLIGQEEPEEQDAAA